MWKTVLRGASEGAATWTIYAVVESLFTVGLPWLMQPRYEFIPENRGFTILLFVIYASVGLSLGAGLGWLAHALGRTRSLRSDNVTALASIFLVNLVLHVPAATRPALLPVLPIYLGLACALAAALVSARARERLGVVVHPWPVACMLVGPLWTRFEWLPDHNAIVVFLGGVGLVLVVLLAALALHALRRGGRPDAAAGPSWVGLAPLVLAALVLALLPGQAPLTAPADAQAESPAPETPNVILITLDTVRADHLSLSGYERETTPHLDAFSGAATLYEHAFAPGAVTLSTHASIFTGLPVSQHGAHSAPWAPVGAPLSPRFRTLAELLGHRGLSTWAVVSNVSYLSHHFGLDQGFEHYDVRSPVIFLGLTDRYYLSRGVRNFLALFAARPGLLELTYRRAEQINSAVFELLDKRRAAGKPFFLFVNYMDAHDPYVPPAPYDTRFPGKDNSYTLGRYHATVRAVLQDRRALPAAEHDHLVSQYDGELAYLDDQLSRLIARLRELDLFDDSMIIVTADHGEAFGEHGMMNHGISVYQDQVGVPLIIKYPGQRDGRRVSAPVSLTELLPTILDVVGGPGGAEIQGRNLGEPGLDPASPVFCESFPSRKLIDLDSRFDRVERALISGRYKFVHATDGRRALYDLSADPEEARDLCGALPDLARRLDTQLLEWEAGIRPPSEEPVELDDDALERLRSLGYVE